jgi:cytochrome c551/c552
MSRPILFLALTGQFALAQTPPTGEADYQVNCIACHQIDTKTGGPSLVAIAETYPKEKEAEFLAWAKAPGKKDLALIEMPSMAHVPDDALIRIHDYILTVTTDKKEQKSKPQFPQFREPHRKLPYVVHCFLPDTSPASLGVVLPGNLTLCWDTESCRVSYVWHNSKTNLANGMWLGKLSSKPFYRETGEAFFSLAEKPTYLGFRLIEGYPEFHYRIGETEVRDLIRNGSTADTWQRTFTLTKPPAKFSLNLAHEGSVTITSDKGKFTGDVLTLTGDEAKSFTLTFSKP